MKRTEPRSIASIIDEALRRGGLEQSMAEHRAAYVWPDVVGPGVTRYTARRYVQGGVLYVYLTSAPLKNELSFHRTRLIEAINRAVGSEAIHDVQFH